MVSTYRHCTGCKRKLELTIENYGINRAVPDGYDYYCKICQIKKRKKQSVKYKQVYSKTGIPDPEINENSYYKRNCIICEKEFLPCSKRHYRCHECSEIARKKVQQSFSSGRKIKGKYIYQPASVQTVNEITRIYIHTYICEYCGREFTNENPKSLDHVIPVSQGGKSETRNIIICCLECNLMKRDKSLDEWLELCIKIAQRVKI